MELIYVHGLETLVRNTCQKMQRNIQSESNNLSTVVYLLKSRSDFPSVIYRNSHDEVQRRGACNFVIGSAFTSARQYDNWWETRLKIKLR